MIYAAAVGGLASSLDASLTLAPGRKLGRYAVVRRLAVGGMAELHLARILESTEPNPYVVIKRVLPHLALDDEFVRLFRNEAQISALLHHPNIVEVTEVAKIEDELCYVMRYVHGENLRRLLKSAREHGGIPLDVGLSIVAAAARGLHHAHEQRGIDGRRLGLVHRDISPSNILIGFDGRVRVADFGIAKAVERTEHTRGSAMKGKVGYMSPEQCQGSKIDCRSDVHALGILLYEATTNSRMFWAEGDFAILSKIVTGDYTAPRERSPGYPDELSTIIERAVQVDAADRFSTAATFGMAIEAFARDRGVDLHEAAVGSFMLQVFGSRPAPGEDEAELLSAPSGSRASAVPVQAGRGRRWPVPVALAAALVGGVGLGGWLQSGGQKEKPPGEEPAAVVAEQPAQLAPSAAVVGVEETDVAEPAPTIHVESAAPQTTEPIATEKPKRTRSRKMRRRAKKSRTPQPKSLFPDEF